MREATEILRSRLFPSECDSLYIENEQDDVYSSTYRMFDTTQVLPKYIVRFASSSFTAQRSLQTGKSPTTFERQRIVYSFNNKPGTRKTQYETTSHVLASYSSEQKMKKSKTLSTRQQKLRLQSWKTGSRKNGGFDFRANDFTLAIR